MIVVLIAFSHDYQIVYLMIECDFDQCEVLGRARSKGVNFRGKLDFPLRQYQNRLLSKKARNLGQAIL